ncbi:MAG: DUF1015 family protein [Actinomycetota bacterium]
MPGFLPFTGLRYDPAVTGTGLDALTCPPYDVIDEEARAALEHLAPHNAVRLILPRDCDVEGDRYEGVAGLLETWRASGALRSDGAPRFYGYRMRFTDEHGVHRHTHGVIGALRLPEPGEADVLPHERTLPKAKSDRLALMRATHTNLEPIWGLSLAGGLTDLLDDSVLLAECRDADGTQHELHDIRDPERIAAIVAAVGSAPVVLADGHHRFETACTYRDELRAAGAPTAGADAILALVVELVEDELWIEPIHRLIDLPAGIDLIARLDDAFAIERGGPATPEAIDALTVAMRERGALGLVDDRGLALAVPRLRPNGPDSAVVEELIVPRLPEADWHYWHDAMTTASFVEKGQATHAVLCSPVSVEQTRAVALASERLPQKTTLFAPKPHTGLVLHPL